MNKLRLLTVSVVVILSAMAIFKPSAAHEPMPPDGSGERWEQGRILRARFSDSVPDWMVGPVQQAGNDWSSNGSISPLITFPSSGTREGTIRYQPWPLEPCGSGGLACAEKSNHGSYSTDTWDVYFAYQGSPRVGYRVNW